MCTAIISNQIERRRDHFEVHGNRFWFAINLDSVGMLPMSELETLSKTSWESVEPFEPVGSPAGGASLLTYARTRLCWSSTQWGIEGTVENIDRKPTTKGKLIVTQPVSNAPVFTLTHQ